MTNLKRKLEVLGGDEDGELMKVAFASTDREYVDQHFGSARAFAIYGVNQDETKLLTISEFAELQPDDDEDKLVEKLALLEGCIAVYCRACGASALKQLLAKGIQPVKVTEGAMISDLIESLQLELRQGPSAWLAKAVSRNVLDPSQFNEMEVDGWEE